MVFDIGLVRGLCPKRPAGNRKLLVSRAEPCLLPSWLVRSLAACSPPGDQGRQAWLRYRESRTPCRVQCTATDFPRRISERDPENTYLPTLSGFIVICLYCCFPGRARGEGQCQRSSILQAKVAGSHPGEHHPHSGFSLPTLTSLSCCSEKLSVLPPQSQALPSPTFLP